MNKIAPAQAITFHGPCVTQSSTTGEWRVYCPACSEAAMEWVETCEEALPFDWPPTSLADAAYKRTIDRRRSRMRIDDNVIAMTSTPTDTQRIAARIALPRSGSKRRELYDMFLRRGASGMTDDEIEHLTGWSHQSASAARNKLMNDGFLVDTGQRRRTRRGTVAIVWAISRAD